MRNMQELESGIKNYHIIKPGDRIKPKVTKEEAKKKKSIVKETKKE
jgi:hypothetical protein